MGSVTSVLYTGRQDYSLWCCTPTVWQAGCDETQITLPSGTWPAKLPPTPCTFVAGSLLDARVHSRQGLYKVLLLSFTVILGPAREGTVHRTLGKKAKGFALIWKFIFGLVY